MNYDLIVEKLMQHFTSEPYKAEVDQAKTEFYKLAGIFDEESPDFEMKMSQFTDWYLFTRPLQKEAKTPVMQALHDKSYKVAEEMRPYYQNLTQNRHSLFEYLKTKGEDVYVRDLFADEKIVIRKSTVIMGFDSDSYFESRLVPDGDNWVLLKSFCFHPPQVSRYIMKEVKRVRKTSEAAQPIEREALILKLFKMKHKHEQYRHVNVKEIYSNEPKLSI